MTGLMVVGGMPTSGGSEAGQRQPLHHLRQEAPKDQGERPVFLDMTASSQIDAVDQAEQCGVEPETIDCRMVSPVGRIL